MQKTQRLKIGGWIVPLLAGFVLPAVADTIVWSGLGANSKWSTTNNWTGGVLPTDTDRVQWGSGFTSGGPTLDAPHTVAGLNLNFNASVYVGGSALTLNGDIKHTGGTSHIYLNCPVVLGNHLTITNEALGLTSFSSVSGNYDMIHRNNLGTHLEFRANNRPTWSGDIYLYGASSNNVLATYKDGGFGTGDVFMNGWTVIKFRGEAQTISNNIAFSGSRAVEYGPDTTDATFNHVGNLTTLEAVPLNCYLSGTRPTVRLSGSNSGPAGSRLIFYGSADGGGRFIIGSTSALGWGYTVLGYNNNPLKVLLEDGVSITNMVQIRDDYPAPVTLGSESSNSTNLVSGVVNLGNFASAVNGTRTFLVIAGTNSLVKFTGRFYESNAGDVLNIVKDGPGIVSMSYASDYKGATIVSNGTLLANNVTGSATSTNAVTVCSGGALGGTGSVTGPVTVQAGGCVAPGDAVGKLTVSNLTFEAGAAFAWDYTAVTQDLLRVTGILTLPAALTVTVNNSSGGHVPHSGRVMMECAGTLSGTPAGWTVTAPNTVRLSESGKQVLLCGPQQGTMLKVW